jgi:probable HAF family extracellular repeat protein
VGQFLDGVTEIYRGFLKNGDTWTPIDAPGATATYARGINTAGQVVGQFSDPAGGAHGFLADGATVTPFDVPGSVATWAFGINDHGQIVGAYQDATGGHGFVLTDRSFTTIDVPGGIDTSVTGINNAGHLVGTHQFGDGRVHGFLFADNQFTTIDVPGTLYTIAYGVNDAGVIMGEFITSHQHGFVLTDGQFTTIDVPGSTATSGHGLNTAGALVGHYNDDTGRMHGFLATPPAGVDKTPPVITVAASPATLWPPNGKRVAVTVSGTITDTEPGGSGVEAGSAAYVVMDEYGQIQPSGNLTLDEGGHYVFTVVLQASRRGHDRDGRHYTIAVSARDNLGHPGFASTTVTVPRK